MAKQLDSRLRGNDEKYSFYELIKHKCNYNCIGITVKKIKSLPVDYGLKSLVFRIKGHENEGLLICGVSQVIAGDREIFRQGSGQALP